MKVVNSEVRLSIRPLSRIPAGRDDSHTQSATDTDILNPRKEDQFIFESRTWPTAKQAMVGTFPATLCMWDRLKGGNPWLRVAERMRCAVLASYALGKQRA